MNTFTAIVAAALALLAPSSHHAIAIEDVDDASMTAAAEQFQELAASGAKEVDLVINSPGGSIFAGLHFLKTAETTKRTYGLHVTCTVDFMSASMGFVILQDSLCDIRLATRRSLFLGHQSSGPGAGKAADVRRQLELSDVLDGMLAEVAGARLNGGVAFYKSKVEGGHDWYFGVDEALAVGAIDGVVEPGAVPLVSEATP